MRRDENDVVPDGNSFTRVGYPRAYPSRNVGRGTIKAHKTAAQIAQMFGVHPTQVGGWKKQALAGLPDIFGNGRDQMRQQLIPVSLGNLSRKERRESAATITNGGFGGIQAAAANPSDIPAPDD